MARLFVEQPLASPGSAKETEEKIPTYFLELEVGLYSQLPSNCN